MKPCLSILILSALLLTGCVFPSETLMYDPSEKYPPKPSTYSIQILDRSEIRRDFKIIGEVYDEKETVYQKPEDIVALMKNAVRAMGGDAMIDFEANKRNKSHTYIPDYVTTYKAKVIIFTKNQ